MTPSNTGNVQTNKLGLAGQSYANRSLTAAAQSNINLYGELIQDPNEREKNVAFLYGIPGRHLFKDLTTIDAAATPIRGIWTGGGRCFVAAGTKYMELDSSGNLVGSVRTISNATVYGFANSPVQFFANGNQLFIISGDVAYVDNGFGPVQVTTGNYAGTVNTFGIGVGWVSGSKFLDDGSWVGQTITINGVGYTIAGGATPPTQTQLFLTGSAGIQTAVAYSFPGINMDGVTGGFLDNTFFANRANSRQFNFGSVNNSTGPLWNGLDHGSKDSWPDHIRGILVDGEQLYLFGDESFEVWQSNPTSGTNTAFVRIDGASGRYGSASPWGPISIQGHLYFIGGGREGKPVAYVMNGFTPVRISQHGQEAVWEANHFGPNCISYSYTEEGHTFWCINFGAQTWCYDLTTGGWHQRMEQSGGNFTPYAIAYHSYIPEFGNGKHLVGGPLDGKIYEQNCAFYDHAGQDIKWQRALPHLYSGNKRMYFSRLELEMETGTAPSGTPVVTLDYSDDRGHTFGTSENASQGTTGQFTTRVYWSALGSAYDRVFRLTGQGQGRVALVDLDLEVEIGTN